MSVLVAAATVTLTGCGALQPGAAAVVGDTRISHEEVDDAAAALCSANLRGAEAQGQPTPDLPSQMARVSAVEIMVDSELSQQFGDARGVEPDRQQVSQALAQNAQLVQLLPQGQREEYRELARGYLESQLTMVEAGRQELGADAPEDQAIAEGQRLRSEFAEGLDISVDPRYGSYENGTVRAGGGSLSVAVSDEAVAGEQGQPGGSWVANLPPSQKCS